MTAADKQRVTSYTTPTDVTVVATRTYDAPRHLLWAAYTEPRHLQQWLLGPAGWTMPECELDLRPGGTWRYTWRKSNGQEMTLTGAFTEVKPPERLGFTESWGGDWPEIVNTVDFAERNGETTVTTTMTFPSREARDAALKTGMNDGAEESYQRLDRYVRSIA
jgi:uncharacterized protein YndB with AHSA1/START domain